MAIRFKESFDMFEAYNSILEAIPTSVLEAVEKHNTLNPVLFDKDDKLKPEVLEKVKEIVDEFIGGLAEDGIKINVKDIILIGSNVSYNYTNGSDLDVHILADTSTLACPDNLYPLLYSAYRSLFNKKFDINFYGIPVELYVETDDSPRVSNGEYSVTKNDWNKKPVQVNIPDIDQDEFKKALKPWEEKYDELINDEELTTAEVEQFINDLYALRKTAISQEGEYAIGNLIFKELRNAGKLDALKDLKNEIRSKELSLESLQASLDEQLPEEPMVLQYKELAEIAGKSPIIQDVGTFEINDIDKDKVDNILKQINSLPYVDCAFKFIEDTNKYTINGLLR